MWKRGPEEKPGLHIKVTDKWPPGEGWTWYLDQYYVGLEKLQRGFSGQTCNHSWREVGADLLTVMGGVSAGSWGGPWRRTPRPPLLYQRVVVVSTAARGGEGCRWLWSGGSHTHIRVLSSINTVIVETRQRAAISYYLIRLLSIKPALPKETKLRVIARNSGKNWTALGGFYF